MTKSRTPDTTVAPPRTPVLTRTQSAREKPHSQTPEKALFSRRSALLFIRGTQTSQIAPFFPCQTPLIRIHLYSSLANSLLLFRLSFKFALMCGCRDRVTFVHPIPQIEQAAAFAAEGHFGAVDRDFFFTNRAAQGSGHAGTLCSYYRTGMPWARAGWAARIGKGLALCAVGAKLLSGAFVK